MEEAELENTDDYVRMKHSVDFDIFSGEPLPSGQIIYKYNNGSVMTIQEVNAFIDAMPGKTPTWIPNENQRKGLLQHFATDPWHLTASAADAVDFP